MSNSVTYVHDTRRVTQALVFLLQSALTLLDDSDDSADSMAVGNGLTVTVAARVGSYRTYQSLVVAIAKLLWAQRIPLATVLDLERGKRLRDLTAVVFDFDTSAHRRQFC